MAQLQDPALSAVERHSIGLSPAISLPMSSYPRRHCQLGAICNSFIMQSKTKVVNHFKQHLVAVPTENPGPSSQQGAAKVQERQTASTGRAPTAHKMAPPALCPTRTRQREPPARPAQRPPRRGAARCCLQPRPGPRLLPGVREDGPARPGRCGAAQQGRASRGEPARSPGGVAGRGEGWRAAGSGDAGRVAGERS